MTTADTLNQRFSSGRQLGFREVNGLAVAEIDTPLASASLCLQGAHLMTWRPQAQAEPVVWLSKLAKLAPGKSIRGGVPVCWPWFGPHATDAKLPAHGFARTVPWELSEARVLGDGAVELALTLPGSEPTRALWPHRTRAELRLTIGATLTAALTTVNEDDHPIVIGEALHTYFHIGDIGAARVRGLEDCAYLDKVDGGARKRQDGAITFAGETDRIYLDTDAECIIDDERLRRRIRVAKTGSRSTVVWTPWTEKADKMGDFGPDGWRGMLCVESANAAENTVTIAPGERHTLAVEYRVENF
ncbi:MAG: D-hexose-6-phosphate mutarotase [Bradyrhizobium sp.]|uniref:D-hexose-6-phosphate mutarotase n=1 Tax=Bradyrhizobium sp. TaxID=376 RepID=UPI003D0D916B